MEGSLHRGKDEKQDVVRMRCNCGIEKGTRLTSMVVMASQMMHHTHNYELNPRTKNKNTKRKKKHKLNGEMEGKWNEKTYDGG